VSKAVIVAILGAIVAFIPIDGLPDRVSTIITVLAGVSIAVLGILMRFERLWLIRARLGGHTTDAYTENGAQQSTEQKN
jgi:hypothetical protein